jgi:hypothetical protein
MILFRLEARSLCIKNDLAHIPVRR